MSFETEKQLEVKASSPPTAIAAVSRAKRKRRSGSRKRHLGGPDAGAPGRREGLRQRRWRFNGVGLTSAAVVLVVLWAAFFGSGENQKLGQDGLRQLIAVAVFFAVAKNTERRKPE